MRPFLYNYLSARFSTVITTDAIKKKFKEKVILRPLPVVKSKVPQFIIYGILGVSLWTISITLSFNYQRLNSSTVQGSLFNVKHDSNSMELLGNNINFSSKYPWVSGSINNLKGIADIKYSIKGDKGKGIVRYHSVRNSKDGKWNNLEFSLTTEDGRTISLIN